VASRHFVSDVAPDGPKAPAIGLQAHFKTQTTTRVILANLMVWLSNEIRYVLDAGESSSVRGTIAASAAFVTSNVR